MKQSPEKTSIEKDENKHVSNCLVLNVIKAFVRTRMVQIGR
jgi:hypothetical protein